MVGRLGDRPSRKRRRCGTCSGRDPKQDQNWWSSKSIVTAVLLLGLHTSAEPFRKCLEEVQKADADSNNELTPNELTKAVRDLSGGHVSSLGSALSAVAAGDLRYQPDTNSESLQALCSSIHQGIIIDSSSHHSMDIRLDRCLFAMAIGDRDRDSNLAQSEYPRYANQVSANQYGFQIKFVELPSPVQDVFEDFSDGSGRIDVTGAKSTESADEGRAEALFRFCRHTAIAILSETPLVNNLPPVAAPVSVPSPVSRPSSNGASFSVCLRMMAFSDLSRDGKLDQAEYLMFANRLNSGTSFSSLPSSLQETFGKLAAGSSAVDISGSRPGQNVDDYRVNLERVCSETNAGIQRASENKPANQPAPSSSPPGSVGFVPSFTFETCKRMMAFSDLSRDNFLDQSEYFRFVNRLGGNAWTGSYATLPSALQASFQSLAPTGRLDVNGSKPGQSNSEDDKDLENICSSTDKAIHAAGKDSSTPAKSPVSPPANSPNGFEPSFDFVTCKRMMAFSDLSRDNSLDEREYFAFVNRLAATKWEGSFSSLPGSVRSVFSDLSTNGGIDVNGSKPGQSIDGKTEALEKICLATDMGIQGVSSSNAGDPPTTQVDTAIEYTKCLRDMIIADTSRDSKLDEKEYVRFVSRSDDQISITDELSSLPSSVQSNFNALAASDGLIDVYGSKPTQNDIDNEDHLMKICSATGAALAQQEQLGLVSGTTDVLNSFTISNNFRLRASQLDEDRKSIESAYAILVRTALAEYTKDRSFLSSEQNTADSNSTEARRLVITNLLSPPKINLMKDNNCPVGLRNGNDYCQSVFGSFTVDFEDEPSKEDVASKLSEYIQNLIDPFLREAHQKLNPRAKVVVVGPSFPVDPKKVRFPELFAEEPTDWGNGPGVGPIVSGVVILVLLFGGGVYCVRSRGLLGKWLRQDPRRQKPKVNDASEVEHTQTGANAYGVAESNLPRVEDVQEEEDEDNESVSFSVQDEDTTQRDKTADNIFNVFQLGGGAKKKTSPDDIRIMDDDFEEGVVEDFADYNFDEPSELTEAKSFGLGDGKGSDPWAGGKWEKSEASLSERDLFGDMPADSSTNNEGSEGSSSYQSHSMSSRQSGHSGMSGNVKQIEGLVDRGDWSGAAKTTSHKEKLDDSYTSSHSEEPSFSSGSSQSRNSRSDSRSDEGSFSLNSPEPDAHQDDFDASYSPENLGRNEWRRKVEDLVKKAAPDELGNVDNMLKRFQGREDELIRTLENMYNRTATNNRFKGVHKSKGIKERDSRGALRGNAEGNAVIAAASMLNSENPAEFDDDEDSQSDEGSMDSGDVSRSENGSYSGSYSESYTGSYTGSHTGSHTDSQASFTGSYTGSYTGSHTGSILSRSHPDHSDSTNYTDNRSYTGSYDSKSTTTFTEGEQSFSLRSNDSGGNSGSFTNSNDDESYTGSHLSESYASQSFSQQSGDFSRSYSENSQFSDRSGSKGAPHPRRNSFSEGSEGSFSRSHDDDSQGSFSQSYTDASFTGTQDGSVSYTGSYTQGNESYSENL